MKKHLQRILFLLCALAMVCVAATVTAEETEARVITVEWKDGNNYDQIRPTSITATASYLDGTEEKSESVTLNEANGWTGAVEVPAGTGLENLWSFETPEGYACTKDEGNVTLVAFHHATAPLIDVSGKVTWEGDDNNARGTRPDSVQLILLADGESYGEPLTAKSPSWTVTWKDLPPFKPNTDTRTVYTVKQLQDPKGYTASVDGLTVTNTLQLSSLQLTASVSGVPEGADVSALSFRVDGPDPSMPRTLSWGQLINGTYDFGSVLPGAYLITNTNADTLVEGYIMDTENSRVADAVYAEAGKSATLSFKYTYKLPEAIEEEEDYDPMANIGSLSFEILGPDERMPMTVTYSQFTNGQFELPDLAPGTYTVVERNAEKLVKNYILTGASVTGMKLIVNADGTSTARLYNQYAPAPTPEPDAEFVDIPVTKTWNDNNNNDGNRPESITVRLYADGVEVDSHVLTSAEGWGYTFIEKPRYQEDHKTEIVYSVSEDAVPMYSTQINGYNIVNNYQPERTSVSVVKIWNDNNNADGHRPASIAMTLSDGQKDVKIVILSDENGWAETVNDLPTVVNGMKAQYAWTEQRVLNYSLTDVTQTGNTMTFTNTLWQRPENNTGGKAPKTPGTTWYVFEDYDTPLGVEVIINHVGDCFD